MHLILEAGLDGFDARERLLVANVARYHRRALPSQNHKLYSILTEQEQRLVSVLASILRIADGLDRTHKQAMSGITVEWSGDACRITPLWANGVPNIADLEGALHKADLFQEVFHRSVVFDFEQNDA
jgi:exopolyphosphatase/guanosine-5'-triphosphate,3'-diphosphate pyrophosphatase